MPSNRNDNRGNPDQPRDEEGRFTDDDNGRSSGGRGQNEQSGRGGSQQGSRGGSQNGGGNQQSGRGNQGNPDQPRDEEGRFTEDDSQSGRGGRSRRRACRAAPAGHERDPVLRRLLRDRGVL